MGVGVVLLEVVLVPVKCSYLVFLAVSGEAALSAAATPVGDVCVRGCVREGMCVREGTVEECDGVLEEVL